MRGGRGLVREYEILSDYTYFTATFGRNQVFNIFFFIYYKKTIKI